MTLTKEKITAFRKLIFDWWAGNRRDLPWRRTRDPYRVLVSEIMLQQTQVSRVLPKYEEFIARYPTVSDLAVSPVADVIRIWKGLGYNRRALYLKKTADAVVSSYQGKFPNSLQELLKLPGLGKYTARALLVFSRNEDIAAVDTNISKILRHYFFAGKQVNSGEIESIAEQLVPKGKSWEWHQALMDYGTYANAKGILKIERKKRKAEQFRSSNRFYRGRIMDHLREGQASEKELINRFSQTHRKSADFIRTIIEGLISDGLVRRREKTLTLPE